MSFVFGTDTYSATDASNSEITTPLSQVLVVLTSVPGGENLQFSNTLPAGTGAQQGSLDFTNPSGASLTFEPPDIGQGLIHYQEGASLQLQGVYFGTDVTQTPLPAALPLFATGLAALGLLGWRRKRGGRPINL
jgi:hypothetical protein